MVSEKIGEFIIRCVCVLGIIVLIIYEYKTLPKYQEPIFSGFEESHVYLNNDEYEEYLNSMLEDTEDTEDTKPLEIVNINTATIDELITLTGIGEVTAIAIIEYRESVGGFVVIEDILNVSGIGQAKFDKIKDYITV